MAKLHTDEASDDKQWRGKSVPYDRDCRPHQGPYYGFHCTWESSTCEVHFYYRFTEYILSTSLDVETVIGQQKCEMIVR